MIHTLETIPYYNFRMLCTEGQMQYLLKEVRNINEIERMQLFVNFQKFYSNYLVKLIDLTTDGETVPLDERTQELAGLNGQMLVKVAQSLLDKTDYSTQVEQMQNRFHELNKEIFNPGVFAEVTKNHHGRTEENTLLLEFINLSKI